MNEVNKSFLVNPVPVFYKMHFCHPVENIITDYNANVCLLSHLTNKKTSGPLVADWQLIITTYGG